MHINNFNSVNVSPPKSSLTFTLKERIPRFTKWVEQGFIIDESFLESLEKSDSLELSFVDLSTNKVNYLNI